jgi:nitrate/nitrite transporter NarK
VSWAPRYLKDAHGVAFDRSEWMTGLPLFVGGISCLVGGYLSDLALRTTGRRWISRAAFPIAGYLVAAVAMLCVPLAKTPAQATLLLCIAAGAHDFGQGANWATIVDVGGTFAGVAAGLINLIGNQANFLQPVVGGYIAEVFGWRPLFAVYCCTYLAAAAMWLLIDPSRKFYENESAAVQGFPVVPASGAQKQ